MARQSTSPVTFQRSTRGDTAVTMTSGRAGVVIPCGYVPLLAGDSASGSVGFDVQLAEMPRPLLNAVSANFQAWFVPKTAFPKFAGRDDLMHSMTGEAIKTLGASDRTPPVFFDTITGTPRTTALASEFFETLGLHVPTGVDINADLIDAFITVYNFRLAAHSSKLPMRAYAVEDIDEATTLPPAFWPSSRLARVVPDYERALVIGSLDLDVSAGRLPVSGIGVHNTENTPAGSTADRKQTAGANVSYVTP